MVGKPWTPAELALLRARYPHETAKAVAQALGVSPGRVYAKARQLGLAKSAAFMASDRSGRMRRGRRDPRMTATQFRKGDAPWNKGVKGSTGLHPNCRRTQFKKGEMAGAAQHNYVPIGSLRISKDGYLERKTTDDPTLVPARRWEAVHRLVWREAHGEIPPHHVVVFLPGRRTTELEQIKAEHLELITRAELARRNHPSSRSPELARLVQLKGAITRQVNRINREAEAARQGATP